MDKSISRVSAEEQARLDACALEPIQAPGTTQSHGVVLIVDGRVEGTWKVSQGLLAAHRFDGAGMPRAEIDTETLRVGAILGQMLKVGGAVADRGG